MNRYDDILARLRAATGPDSASGPHGFGERPIDADIFQMLGGENWHRAYMKAQEPCGCPHDMAIEMARERFSPRYTGSIDLSIALLMEISPAARVAHAHQADDGWLWQFSIPGRHACSNGHHQVSAIAILIALFEALKAKEE